MKHSGIVYPSDSARIDIEIEPSYQLILGKCNTRNKPQIKKRIAETADSPVAQWDRSFKGNLKLNCQQLVF